MSSHIDRIQRAILDSNKEAQLNSCLPREKGERKKALKLLRHLLVVRAVQLEMIRFLSCLFTWTMICQPIGLRRSGFIGAGTDNVEDFLIYSINLRDNKLNDAEISGIATLFPKAGKEGVHFSFDVSNNSLTTRGYFHLFRAMGHEYYKNLVRADDILSLRSILHEAVAKLASLPKDAIPAAVTQRILQNDKFFMEGMSYILGEWDQRKAQLKPPSFYKRGEMVQRCIRHALYLNHINNNPEILKITIPQVVAITGLYRTGTTMLFNLMGKAEKSRVPMLWEIYNPYPPPKKETYKTDERIKIAEREVNLWVLAGYTVRSMHNMEADWPEECMFIMREEQIQTEMYLNGSVPTYSKWFEEQDPVEFYKRCYRFLQFIGSEYAPESHWLIKAPIHLFYFDKLIKTYGLGTKIIFCHRDPIKAVGSSLSLLTYIGKIEWVGYDEAAAARKLMKGLAAAWKSTMKILDEFGDKIQVEHVYFESLMKEPISTVRNLHLKLGLPWSEEKNVPPMEEWINDNPAGKHGKHEYSLSTWGIKDEEVYAEFAEYYDRFFPNLLKNTTSKL